MKKSLFVVLVCSLFSLSAFGGNYIVQFKGNGASADFAQKVAAAGGTVTFQHNILALVSGVDANGAASIAKFASVADVQEDAEFSLDVTAGDAEANYEGSIESASNPTTAAFYPRQWHLRQINAHLAWAAGFLGSPNVRVAILDTGIDRRANQHPDLVGRVDYNAGAQFQLDNPLCIPAGYTFQPTDDLVFHGTHVAATVSSNALAAAGVTSGVTLIPVKVLGLTSATPTPGGCSNGSGSLGAVLAGVLYAADIDADVANMSLGGGFAKAANGRFIGLINSTFNYAHRQGLLVVVSAGNEALDLDHDGNLYKTYCSSPNTICVSATGPTATAGTNGPWTNPDALAGYSNYGRSAISVAAPGGNASPVTAACSRGAVSAGLAVCRTGTFVVGSNGTSMASPHVSGLAALLVGQIGKDKPAQVKAAIEQSADDLGQPGTDPAYGKGRINVTRALGLQ
ncbi:MAG TPA: S8 family serine peptidase [Thermoanaerobaculia bacterium]|nr:S8 family serine peptidase [Thermoanaerobaculia bacterium]